MMAPRLSNTVREAAAAIIAREFGLTFPGAQESYRDAALLKAAAACNETSIERLLARATSGDGPARDALTRTLTVGESYFFRDPNHFALLRTRVLPALARRIAPVRIWSAGCSSGEEAYSLAIAAMDVLGDPARVEVLATDLNADALARAAAATYRPWSFRGTDPATMPRWFARENDQWHVRAIVRDRVRFAPLNFVAPDAIGRAAAIVGAVDVIFCRNVLLYFEPASVAAAARVLASALAPDGWLFPGASDPPLPDEVDLHAHFIGGVRVYRRTPSSSSRVAVALPVGEPGHASPKKNPDVTVPPSRRSSSLPPLPSPSPPSVDPISDAEGQARARADAGDVTGALALTDEALRADPMRAPLYVLRATLDLAQSAYTEATLDAARASLLDRALAMPHVLAATAWLALGEHDAVERAIRQAMARVDTADPREVPGSGGMSGAAVLDVCRHLAKESRRKRAGGGPR